MAESRLTTLVASTYAHTLWLEVASISIPLCIYSIIYFYVYLWARDIQSLIYWFINKFFNIFQKVAKTAKNDDVIGEWATKKEINFTKYLKATHKKHILSHLPFNFVFFVLFFAFPKTFLYSYIKILFYNEWTKVRGEENHKGKFYQCTHWHVSTAVYKWWHLAQRKLLKFIYSRTRL